MADMDAADGGALDSGAGFPGWRWAIVGLSFPIAGYIGWWVSGPVDAPAAALLGGALTGAGLGAAEWFAARGTFGNVRAWLAASALGYGAGLVIGAAVVGYETDLGSLALMGALTGMVLGTAQGAVLATQDRIHLGIAWAAAMPILLALGWAASTLIGVDVDQQFTVFGAMGAIVFTVLSGLLLARSRPPATRAAV